MSSLMKECCLKLEDEGHRGQKFDPQTLSDTPGKPRHLYGDHTNPFGTPTKLTECYDVRLEDDSVLRLEMDGKTANVIQSFITMCGGIAPVALEKASVPHYQKL